GAALNGILHALGNRHFGDALNESLPALGVRFRGGSGVGQGSLVDGMGGPVKFAKLIFLFRGQGGGMLESSGERGRCANAVEVLGLEMRAACANRKFTFTRGPAVPKVFHNFRA